MGAKLTPGGGRSADDDKSVIRERRSNAYKLTFGMLKNTFYIVGARRYRRRHLE